MRFESSEFITSAADRQGWIAGDAPEIAVAGRSNVGKSSLINALTRRKKLAKTSSTPGKTQLINFFRIDDGPVLVDLPGYGWAKVPRGERDSWQRLVESYLEQRPELRAAMLLQDLRREISEDETLLLEWLAERDVPSMMVLTKIDKLKPMRRKARIAALAKELRDVTQAVLPTSSQNGDGIEKLWRQIFDMIQS